MNAQIHKIQGLLFTVDAYLTKMSLSWLTFKQVQKNRVTSKQVQIKRFTLKQVQNSFNSTQHRKRNLQIIFHRNRVTGVGDTKGQKRPRKCKTFDHVGLSL